MSPWEERGLLPQAPSQAEWRRTLAAAAQECGEVIDDEEPLIADDCQLQGLYREELQEAAEAYAAAVAAEPRFVGRDLRIRVVSDDRPAQLSGATLNLLECANDPTGFGARLNAFATPHLVVILEPLADALYEGAAAVAKLTEEAGGREPDEADLMVSLGEVFRNAQAGLYGEVLPPEEIDGIHERSARARELWRGALSFVLFHEIAHANLGHGLFRHMMVTGILDVLLDREVLPDPRERQELDAFLLELAVATEHQADIYAAHMLRHSGLGFDGVSMLFLGMQGSGLDDAPVADHAPSLERLELVRSIVVDRQDRFDLLRPDGLKRLLGAH